MVFTDMVIKRLMLKVFNHWNFSKLCLEDSRFQEIFITEYILLLNL